MSANGLLALTIIAAILAATGLAISLLHGFGIW